MSTEKLCSRLRSRNSHRPASGSSSRLHLVEEVLHDPDRGLRADLADEARVREGTADGEHHLAVDVVLDVLERLVADPDRPVAVVAGQVLELPLVSVGGAVDPVRGLEDALALLGDVAQVLERSISSSGRAARARSA